MTQSCEHFVPSVETDAPLDVCSTCIEIGGSWVHLRQCLHCGRTSCCDNSPNRHATAHFHDCAHPVMQSAEPGEDWAFCYVDQRVLG